MDLINIYIFDFQFHRDVTMTDFAKLLAKLVSGAASAVFTTPIRLF